jgi:hypothetical protein
MSRLPGIWIPPNSNDLHIRFSGIGYTDKGFKNIKIPTGVTSQIQIDAVGNKVDVLVNGVVTQFMDLPDTRITGPAILYTWLFAHTKKSLVFNIPCHRITGYLIDGTLNNDFIFGRNTDGSFPAEANFIVSVKEIIFLR